MYVIKCIIIIMAMTIQIGGSIGFTSIGLVLANPHIKLIVRRKIRNHRVEPTTAMNKNIRTQVARITQRQQKKQLSYDC